MRVDVSYADGRLESFDTDRFTVAEPFAAKSMLADLALAFREDGSLVLRADCYDVRDVEDGATARRRRGWSFLLISCEESPRVLSVAVDGTVRWSRVGPDLADVGRLRALGAMWHPGGGSTAQLAVWLHDLACQAHPELLGTRDGEDEICGMIGMTRASYEYLSDLVAII